MWGREHSPPATSVTTTVQYQCGEQDCGNRLEGYHRSSAELHLGIVGHVFLNYLTVLDADKRHHSLKA